MVKYEKLSFLLLVFIAVGVFYIPPVSALENFVVKVGENKVFTEFNYADTSFANDPNNILPWPDTREAYADGNVARVSSSAGIDQDQAVVAQAQRGIQFEWDLGQYTWEQVKNKPIRVTVNYAYEITANWVEGYGSANAGVFIPYFSQDWDAFIGREIGQSGSKSNTVSKTYTGYTPEMLEGLNRRIYLETYSQVHKAASGIEPHSSSAEVIINSITIEFLPDTSIPEFPSFALPVLSVIGLMLLFQRRNGK